MGFKRILSVLLLCWLCMAGFLFAQSDRATVTGAARDASGAVLPGVKVEVTNIATNLVSTAVTNTDGIYRISNLPIGNYTLVFSHEGFKAVERKEVTLMTSQIAEINAVLQIGVATEVVEVTGVTPMLQSQDATVSANLDAKAVTELPLNVQGSRNLSNFMFAYVPGVEGGDYSSHINGSVALSKEVMIDGTSAVSQLGGYISESQPPMEAVQEFQADTAGIGADAGRSGGGVFRYEMKSGTNAIHGSLFGFLHSTSLDALSASNRLAVVTDPANAGAYLKKSDSLSDWGGSFGGAIIKDKLFYFVSFERYMQANWALGPNSRTVPTDAMMGLNADGSVAQYADLSKLLTTSVTHGNDPCGNAVYRGSVFNPATNCVFVNNQIPTNLISKTSAQILQLYHNYYAPESDLPTNNAGNAYNPDPWFHNTQTSVKIDYNFSDKNHLNGSYYYDNYPRINADQGGAWSANSPYGGPMANAYWHNTTAPSVRLSDSHMFTPNVLNVAHFTWNRFRNPSIAVSQSDNWDNKLGFYDGAGNFPLITYSSGMYTNWSPNVNGWYYSNLGSQFNDYYAANTYIYNDEVAWTKGRHAMKFGAEFRAMQFNSHPDSETFNNITFDPTSTASSTWYNYGWNEVGSSFASFLLGDVYQATGTAVDPQYGRRKAFSLYAMDDFRVNDRLTVNMSLRWDYNSPYKEKYGHWSSWVTDAMNQVSGTMGQYQYLTRGDESFEKRQQWANFGPHVGAAYKINEKTVVRGSVSVFFVPLNMNTWGGIPYQQTGNPGYYQHSIQQNFNWDNGYQPVLSQVQKPDYTQWGVVMIDPRSLTPGNTQQYQIGVQRELTRDTKLEAVWIQSHSYHLQSGTVNTNQPTVENMQNYVLHGEFPADYNHYWDAGGPGWQGITPYPQIAVGYGPMFSVGSPLGNSDYKSFQASVTKRASKGLSLMGSYNWSQAHGDVDSSMGELWWAGAIQNVYDLKNEAKDIAGFDMTHIVKGYVIYDLPFGHGQAFGGNVSTPVDYLIGGWSLNGSFHYNTGTPISVHSTNSYPGYNAVYVNMVAGCDPTNGSAKLYKQWLNAACFANPANAELGTAGNFQDFLRNPGLATEDIGLHKGLAFGPDGRYNFTFRLEFFNIFNRHQFAGPDTNLGSPTFGQITGYTGFGGRTGQFGARFTF
ncbi:Cna B-type protein [Candidatus Koribacter versatilis Ellin345]|uniref:Cna B-type protein n=1 Tax=Koribacter versatilis (strain Ellin345) TaxID=204669 RepID=Q1IP11_KORVE|nr:TonB-dependent receptor [Candidatus Koribacter versatilis]ABF41389.1 Cna B-type protein [Candidatus Koribacter versatilis Ellin345]